MAISKVCGIETEYGVLARGVELSAVGASTILVNAYAGREFVHSWDFSSERPHVDSREGGSARSSFPETEYHLANTVLTNGSRFYVDHAHPEISSPECRTALEAVQYDLAADQIMRLSMSKASKSLDSDSEIVVYKNNSDGKGNSYGCHENYLVERSLPFGRLASMITSHFVTRQVFCGSGKIGFENHVAKDRHGFQISQRADFFEEEIGLETTIRRPIVNSRDEPHANAEIYRRLHVIVGDANMSEVATFLKIGTTSLVLAMIEDDAFPEQLLIRQPVPAIRSISADTSLTQTIEMVDGRRLAALEVQECLLQAAKVWAGRYGLGTIGEECGERILSEWTSVIEDLNRDPYLARDRVDWVAKMALLDAYAKSRSLSEGDPKLKLIDLQYHDLRPERGLAAKAGLRRLIEPAVVQDSIAEPPLTTRAYFRGKVLQKWPELVVAANWDSVVLDVGGDALVRIPMDEPLRGTYELVGELIARSEKPADLVSLLRLKPPAVA